MTADELKGKYIAFADNLLLLTRADAIRLAESSGAQVLTRLSKKADLLVVGIDGWPLESGGAPSGVLQKAHRLHEQGGRLKVISELKFVRSTGADELLERFRSQYTPAQIGRILDIAPEQLRKWIRHGLLKPSRTINRLPWFDFTGLSFGRKLKQLSEGGISVSQIEMALNELAAWFPAEESGLAQIEPMFATPVIRLKDGSPAELSGQLMLDFEDLSLPPAPPNRILPFQMRRSEIPEEWFRIGVKAEDDGDLTLADQAYHKALLAGGPDAETCFNLGNVLYRLGREAEAVQRYLQTVEIEPEYVEAWNNLGIALGAVGRFAESIDTFRNAVAIEPHYGDAHYNLAEALEQTGRKVEAREHWLAYLKEDPDSDLAKEVRRRIKD